MHGVAIASLNALARTQTVRSLLAGLSVLQRHPRTQAAAVAVVDVARGRPGLTLTALAAALIFTGLAARAGVNVLARLASTPAVPSATELGTTPPTLSPNPAATPLPAAPPIPEPTPEPEPAAVATLPPISADLATVPAEAPPKVVRIATPVLLPRQIVEARNIPTIHLPTASSARTGGAVAIPLRVSVAGHEPSSVVIAFKKPEESPAEPSRTALAEAPADSLPMASPESELVPVGCSSCGGGGGTLSPAIGPPDGFAIGGGTCSSCGGATCVPGRTPCYPCSYQSTIGRFFCGVYECVCCPDPCYEPRWTPVTDSSFFTDAPRPITHQRFRWDTGMNLQFPDRAAYFWSPPPLGPTFIGIPYRATPSVNYNDLSVYTEIATNFISLFVEMPYRTLNAEQMSQSPAAGFGDINLGTKSLLFDCELFQISLQMKTYILSGNFSKGLGTGHMSLEPSILFGLRISPDTYLQTQVGEWIPFTTSYGGACLKANASLNQVLWRVLPNVPLVGTWELQTLSFQDGAYTDPYLGPWQKASGYTYINAGPGLRLFVCDRIDFGVGSSFALTEKHFAQTLFRSEFRVRY